MKRLILAAILTPALLLSCRRGEPAAPARDVQLPGAIGPVWIPPLYHPQQSRASWHETFHRAIEGNRITIVYGRPYITDSLTGKPRSVWGGQLVPYNKIWRLGADEATLFITQQDIEMGGVTIPAGAYTLYFHLYFDDSAELLINSEVGQWGLDPPNQAREFARVRLTHRPLAEVVDPFTISVDNGERSGGVLRLAWDKLEYSVAFQNKSAPDPKAHITHPDEPGANPPAAAER